MSENSQKSIVALGVAVAVLVVGAFGIGWNFLLSAVLAVAAYFGVSHFSKGSSESPTSNVAPMKDPVPSPSEEAASARDIAPPPEQSVAEPPVAEPVQEATPDPAPAKVAVQPGPKTAGLVKLGTILPGEADLAARRGGWRYEG